ncbi:MAG: amidohydrolase, partial [Saprospiraceae bacterium]|nr:amidohydrolase [Saprospiraceae bacterium]
MNIRKGFPWLASLLLMLLPSLVLSQETFPRNDVADQRSGTYALTHATIIVKAGEQISNATLLIRDGKIEAVAQSGSIPSGYQEVDLTGKYIYPSFVDLHTHYGLPEPDKDQGGGGYFAREQIPPKVRGAHSSNDAIKAHYRAGAHFDPNSKAAESLRKQGFGTVLSFRDDGIARGTSTLVTLGNNNANTEMILSDAAAHFSLSKGTSRQNYPRSMMGYISLLRQTFLDADWYGAQSPKPYADQALEAWIDHQDKPQIFDAGSWINALRADKIGDEFGIQYIICGGTDLYKRIDEIKNTDAQFIVPLNFPEAFDVEDPLDAEKVTLGDMLHWELAPGNAAALENADVTFAFTGHGLKKGQDLIKNIRTSIKHGLSKETALAALTTVPAEMVGAGDIIGSLEKGKLANFLITSGELFEEKTIIHENWTRGHRHAFKPLSVKDHAGTYQMQVGQRSYSLEVDGQAGKEKCIFRVDDSTEISVNCSISENLVNLNFLAPGKEGKTRLSGWVDGERWAGKGQLEDGSWVDWDARRTKTSEAQEKQEEEDEEEPQNLGKIRYPFVAYGLTSLPEQGDLLIKNTTVWTNEEDGILVNTDVLLQNGKIARIGPNLRGGNARIIDGTGKHLTAGIIDEHTHIAGGGNDVATNSGMVRIGDQVNSEQISIYRTLAGGVTAAQVLHGSANPIGGQSALIKLRWGAAPEDLKIEGADEFIKFALGENVKRSRSQNSIRYPQTRMGVEQVYVDAFSQAEEYGEAWKRYQAGTGPKPRRDLAQEAMLEIINGERFITCHSYVQSEINMLMKVAERFGFTINTFTHIMEGYKVADKMAKHGVGGSSFSDWWNYKWEV